MEARVWEQMLCFTMKWKAIRKRPHDPLRPFVILGRVVGLLGLAVPAEQTLFLLLTQAVDGHE